MPSQQQVSLSNKGSALNSISLLVDVSCLKLPPSGGVMNR